MSEFSIDSIKVQNMTRTMPIFWKIYKVMRKHILFTPITNMNFLGVVSEP
jgi:hypothetical protein